MAPCRSVDMYGRFGGISSFNLQGGRQPSGGKYYGLEWDWGLDIPQLQSRACLRCIRNTFSRAAYSSSLKTDAQCSWKYLCPNTVFTRMQGNSNLRRRTPPPNKTSANKKKCYYFYTINIQPVSGTICHYQSVSLSPSPQSVSSSCSHSLSTFPSSSLPFHIISLIISPIHCTALLKNFTVISGEMRCHAVMIHLCIYISWFINLLEFMMFHKFFSQMVLMVLRTEIHVLWTSVSCLWSNKSEFMALFYGF